MTSALADHRIDPHSHADAATTATYRQRCEATGGIHRRATTYHRKRARHDEWPHVGTEAEGRWGEVGAAAVCSPSVSAPQKGVRVAHVLQLQAPNASHGGLPPRKHTPGSACAEGRGSAPRATDGLQRRARQEVEQGSALLRPSGERSVVRVGKRRCTRVPPGHLGRGARPCQPG